MKRMIKVLLILAATVAAVAALAITAGATELKTVSALSKLSGGLRLALRLLPAPDILSTAHNGDNVVVIRQVGDWYLVNYNLKIGYMHSDYITFKERENIELGYGSVDPYLANIRSGPSTSSGLVDQAGQRREGLHLRLQLRLVQGEVQRPEAARATPPPPLRRFLGQQLLEQPSLGQQIAVFGMQYVGYPLRLRRHFSLRL